MRATIRTKLIIVFTVIVVVPVAIVGIQAYAVSRRVLAHHIGKSLERQAKRVMDQIDRTLFERYQNVNSWSADALMLDVPAGDPAGRISRLLTAAQRQYGLYAGLLCADDHGRVVAASQPRLIGRDVSGEPWFQRALTASSVQVYDLASSELFGGISLIFAAPIRGEEGALEAVGEEETGAADPARPAKPPVGVFVAAMNWSEILILVNTMPILEEMQQNPAGYAILIDHNGLALTQPFFDERELMLERNVRSKKLGLLASGNDPSAFLAEDDLYGHPALIGFARSLGYRGFRGLGWQVLVFQRSTEALRPVRALQWHILLSGLVVVLLVIPVALVLTRRITTPVLRMASVASRIAREDFEGRVTWASGDEIGFLVSSFNRMVEDLQRQRAQLVEKAFVDNVIGSMLNSLIVAGPSGRIRTVNQATCALLGYGEQELIGEPLEAVVEQVLSVGAGIEAFASKGPVERVYRAKDRRQVPVLFSSALMRDADGSVEGIVCVAQDLSERKRAEESLQAYAQQLAHSNAELEQFAYVASHDLQEPLRMVASYTQLLARRYQDKLDEDARTFIRFAVGGATRMQQLISDLLQYSRVGTKGKPFAPTSAEAVFDQILVNLQVAIQESGAVIRRGPLPTVMADELQLGQLFQNLLGNAIKFRKSGAPAQIEVAAVREDEAWRFEVKDDGIGFDQQYADRIFVVFQRLHTSEEYPGTGIGLAICKKIVERHGGRIWADSHPGEGAAFFFTLPDTPQPSPHG